MEFTNFNFTYLAVALLYGLALFNCVHVLTNRLNPGATIAWISVNLALPFIGIPLYYVVGNYRITGYRRLHKRKAQAFGWERKPVQLNQGARKDQLLKKYGTVSPIALEFAQVFRSFGEIFEPNHAEIDLLIDGKNTFDAIFQAIADAKQYIFIQYYILRSDRLGLELKDLLIEKAREGVPIYILYDDMGSFWLSRQYIKDLRNSGVHIARFLPLTKLRRFFQVNFRNHRKTVVVDGRLAFTGGLNVGEEYAASRYKSKKRLFNYWRDTHIQIKGPLVKHFEGIFFEDWFFATKQRIDKKKDKFPNHVNDGHPSLEYKNLAQVIPTGPADETMISLLMLQLLINSAKERLWIASPYLVLDPVIVSGLELAARRGVDVRIMIPAIPDYLWVHWVSLSYADQMTEKGCQIYLYKKGFMHQKVFLADTNVSIVGTMNLDNRAIYLNFETSVVIHDTEFNNRLAATLAEDFTHCELYRRPQKDIWLQLKRFRNNIARIFGPLL